MRTPYAALLVVLLSACGSSPKTHFYTLDAVPPAQTASRPADSGPPIVIGHVDLPGTLDRPWLVTRASGDRLDISDQDRWGAPLDELVRRALTKGLRERLPSGTVLAPGDPTPPKVRTVSLNVQQFMADETGRVELDADWTLQQQNRPARTRHEMIQVNAGGTGGEAIAAAMSQAVGQLADRISAGL